MNGFLSVLTLILIGGGALTYIVTGIWLLVTAFRRSILWGLAVLFLPFVALIFVIACWEDAKRPFKFMLLSIALMLGGVALGQVGGSSSAAGDGKPSRFARLFMSGPEIGYTEFAAAVSSGDPGKIFEHLTPAAQNTLIAEPVRAALAATGGRRPAQPAPRLQQIDQALQRRGIQLYAERSGPTALTVESMVTERVRRVTDKAAFYADVVGEYDGTGYWMGKAILGVKKDGDSASATVRLGTMEGDPPVAIKFQRSGETWLIDFTDATDPFAREFLGRLPSLASVKTDLAQWVARLTAGSRPGTASTGTTRPSTASLSELEARVKTTPGDPEAWYEIAAKRAAFGKWAEATADLRKAFELGAQKRSADPDQPDWVAAAGQDARFKSLREKPEYRALIQEAAGFGKNP